MGFGNHAAWMSHLRKLSRLVMGQKWPLGGVHKQDLDGIFPWRIRCGGNAPVLYWTALLRPATYHDE